MDLIFVLSLLALVVGLFAWGRPRMDAVAILALTALPLSGIVTTEEALAGFSDPNIILIAALFVLGECLVRSGVAARTGDLLLRHAGGSEVRLIILLMLAVASIGAFMSSTGVVAIFIPIVLRLCQRAGLAPGRLMMALSVAALISGMMTLVATAPNLVLDSLLRREGFEGFSFFSFTPFGLPVLICAILWMLVARFWLARDQSEGGASAKRPRLADQIALYGLEGRSFRLGIAPASPLGGQRLDALNLRASAGITILGIERRGRMLRPEPGSVLQAGDILLITLSGQSPDFADFVSRCQLTPLDLTGVSLSALAQDIGMAELIIPPGSELEGSTASAARFRSRFGLTLIGLRRSGEPVRSLAAETRLRGGDVVLAVGPWPQIRALRDQPAVVLMELPREADEVLAAPHLMPSALAVMALVITLMVSGLVPNLIAALAGCLLMGLLRCIDMPAAYRAIHWQSLVLIIGMMPFSIALQNTGGVDLAAAALSRIAEDAGPRSALALVFLTSALLGLFISNTATAVLMGPVAFALAQSLCLSPYPFVMTVALAASAAFLTPVSSPVNTLVVEPGGYGFGDFLKTGLPLLGVVLAVSLGLIPLIFPFEATDLCIAAQ